MQEQAAARFADGGAQIVSVQLLSLDTRLSQGLKPGEAQVNIGFEVFAGQVTEVEGTRILIGRCRFSVQPAGSDPIPMTLTAEIGASYRLINPSITEDDCSQFLESQMIRHLWPYFRELLYSMSLRMLIFSPLMVPFMPPVPVPQGKPSPQVAPATSTAPRRRKSSKKRAG